MKDEQRGSILAELQKLREYHAKQVKNWKDLLQSSLDKTNPYARRMIAMHEEFGGVLSIVAEDIAKSKNLEGTAT